MKRIIFAIALITIFLGNFYQTETVESDSLPNDLIVHEWGTFTSIAGKDGTAIDWRPLDGTSDLPTFVYTSANKKGWRGSYQDPGKGRLAKVRMETPVIYFYTKKAMEVDVKVAFPGGTITEWYPQAGWANARFESGINWGKVKLLPNESPVYLRETADSHYYPARETDSVAVQICNFDKTKIEKEKFLFYRGVGNFGLPLSAKIDGKNLTLKNSENNEIKKAIVFENKGGRVGFKFIETLSKETILERPETNKNISDVLIELEKILVAEGLYAKEAKAMIETWKDSWFEEGLRVFYVLTSQSVDEILPLQIEPKPKETVRVIIGRTEIITPEMETDVRKQVEFLHSKSERTREEARNYLKKYGRFYEPILKNILEEEDKEVRRRIQKLIDLS